MTHFKTLMDIFKLLDKSNCRACNEKTCLAFAAAVFQGRKQLDQCPQLSADVIERYGGQEPQQKGIEENMDAAVADLKALLAGCDLKAAAQRLDVPYHDDKLTIDVFGKKFQVGKQGQLYADIHINPWILVPIAAYILEGAGKPPTGRWAPFRELRGGRDRYRLFRQRCERPIKRLADTTTDFFKDLIELFNGQPVEKHYQADISLVLRPLPKMPLLICYWKPEEEMASDLTLFFDETAPDNLPIDALYTLVAGLVQMFEKIGLRHGMQV